MPGTAIVNCFPKSFVPQTEGWYSVGIHPWYIASFAASLNDSKARFEELLDHPQVLAVGEAGLDKLAEAPLTLQIEVFEYQARLAEEANKPLIIHLVKAVDELLKLKQKIQQKVKVNVDKKQKEYMLREQMKVIREVFTGFVEKRLLQKNISDMVFIFLSERNIRRKRCV